jgi:hypothetical protein
MTDWSAGYIWRWKHGAILLRMAVVGATKLKFI